MREGRAARPGRQHLVRVPTTGRPRGKLRPLSRVGAWTEADSTAAAQGARRGSVAPHLRFALSRLRRILPVPLLTAGKGGDIQK